MVTLEEALTQQPLNIEWLVKIVHLYYTVTQENSTVLQAAELVPVPSSSDRIFKRDFITANSKVDTRYVETFTVFFRKTFRLF